MEASVATRTTTTTHPGQQALYRGLLLREWWAHRQLLVWIGHIYVLSPAVMVFGAFIFEGIAQAMGLSSYASSGLSGSPDSWMSLGFKWTYWMGIMLAVVLGIFLGGTETTAGLEEGSLSLPPTRAQRFTARCLFAASLLVAHGLVNAIALNIRTMGPDSELKQIFAWDWFAITGLGPLVIFSLAWTVAVNGGPRRKLIIGIAALALPYLAFVMSSFVTLLSPRPSRMRLDVFWGNQGELAIQFLLLAWALWMFWLSYRIYCTREVHAARDE